MTSATRLNCNLFLLSGSFEEQWFLHCLSELQPRIFRAYRDSWHQIAEYDERNALDIYYTNPTNKEGRDALAAVRAARKPELGHGLLIGGDENFLTSPRLYYGARFVIRTYLAAFHHHPRIFTLPEGPFYRPQSSTNDLANPHRPISAFFSGQLKYSRVGMAKAFRDCPGSYINDPCDTKLAPQDYLNKLASARFALCPNGNTTPDTLRLYEALEIGIVPIAEKTWLFDYLGSLFPCCPVPRFKSWRSARHFIDSLDADGYELIRSSINSWWQDQKATLPIRVADFVLQCTSSNAISELKLTSRLGEHQYRIKSLAYLLAIASPGALRIRIRKLPKKLYQVLLRKLGTIQA